MESPARQNHAFASPTAVMAGHSRPKDGVATLAYDPAIHDLLRQFETLHGPPGQARGDGGVCWPRLGALDDAAKLFYLRRLLLRAWLFAELGDFSDFGPL